MQHMTGFSQLKVPLCPISPYSIWSEITSRNPPLKRDQFIALLALPRRSWNKYVIPQSGVGYTRYTLRVHGITYSTFRDPSPMQQDYYYAIFSRLLLA